MDLASQNRSFTLEFDLSPEQIELWYRLIFAFPVDRRRTPPHGDPLFAEAQRAC